MSENVKVVVRIRPFLPHELANEQEQQHWKQQLSLESSYSEGAYLSVVENQVVIDNNRTFAFDAVLDAQSTQVDVFNMVGKDVVEAFLDGRNAATIAYGQTGAGKTYTMQSLTMNVIDAIFAQLENRLTLVNSATSRRPSSLSNTLTANTATPETNETHESKIPNNDNNNNINDNTNNTHSTFLSSTTSYSNTTTGQTNTTSTMTVRSSLASSSLEESEEEEEEKEKHVEHEEHSKNNNEECTSSPSFKMLVSVLEVYNDTLKDLITLNMIPTEDGNDHGTFDVESCQISHNHHNRHRRHSYSIFHHSTRPTRRSHSRQNTSPGVNSSNNNKYTSPCMTSPCKALSPSSRSCTPLGPHRLPSSCCTALSPSLLSSPSSLSPINYNGMNNVNNNNRHEQEEATTLLPTSSLSSHISAQSTRSRREERLNSFSSCNSIPSPTSLGAMSAGDNNNFHNYNNKGKVVLQLREDAKNGVYVHPLTQVNVHNANQLKQIISRATSNRHTATTLLNANSSRSHCIVTLTLHYRGTTSKMCFVDLAGSERLKKSLGLNKNAAESLQALLQLQSHSNAMSSPSSLCGANNITNNNNTNFLSNAEADALVMARMREGISVNTGLLALGNVIVALCEHKPHIPYRASKLTRLLQPMLNGLSQTCMVACISPSYGALEETLNTLKYAYRAKSIKIHPQVMLSHFDSREDAERTIIALRLEIKELQNKLNAMTQEQNSLIRGDDHVDELDEQHTNKETMHKEERQQEESMLSSSSSCKVENQSIHCSTNMTVTPLKPNDQISKQTTEQLKERVLHSSKSPSAHNEAHSSMLTNMEAKIMYLENELAAERTLTHKLEEDVFRAEYTAMVEIEKRKVLEQRLEEVEMTRHNLQYEEEENIHMHDKDEAEEENRLITSHKKHELLKHSSKSAIDSFDNSLPEHILNTPLSPSNDNENMNASGLVHVWNTTNTTSNNSTKPQRNRAYQDRKCKSNSPEASLPSLVTSATFDSIENNKYSRNSSESIMFRSETNSFTRNESKLREESEIPEAKVTMCFIDDDDDDDDDDEANRTTNNVNLINSSITTNYVQKSNEEIIVDKDVVEKQKELDAMSAEREEENQNTHDTSKPIERDRSNSLNKLTVVKFNTLLKSDVMEEEVEEKHESGSKLHNHNNKRKPSLMTMKRSVSHFAPITTHSIFDEDHVSVMKDCNHENNNTNTDIASSNANSSNDKDKKEESKVTNEIKEKYKKYEELLHQHRRLVRTASAQPFLALRSKTSNTTMTSTSNDMNKNNKKDKSSSDNKTNDNNYSVNNNSKIKRFQSNMNTIPTPKTEAITPTNNISKNNNNNTSLEKLKEQWQSHQKTRPRGKRREIGAESNVNKQSISQHMENVNKKSTKQCDSAAERDSSSIRTKGKNNCSNSSASNIDLQISQENSAATQNNENKETKNVTLEPFQRTNPVAKILMHNTETKTKSDNNNGIKEQSIKKESHSPDMLEQHVTKEMENAIAKFKAMNTEATHVGNQNKPSLLHSSLSSVSVNSNSQQDHVQHAIDSELRSLEEIEREVEELERYRLVLSQLQKTKESYWAERIGKLTQERSEMTALLQNNSGNNKKNDKEQMMLLLSSSHSTSSHSTPLSSSSSSSSPATTPVCSSKQELEKLEKSSSLSIPSLTTNVPNLESSGESAPLLSSTAAPLNKWSVASSELPLLHHVHDRRKLKGELHKLKVEIEQVHMLAEMTAKADQQMEEVELRLESLHEVRRLRSQRVRRLQHLERENLNNTQELSVSSFASSLHTNIKNNATSAAIVDNNNNNNEANKLHSDAVKESDRPFLPLANVFEHNLPLSSLPQSTKLITSPPPLPSVREITSSRVLLRTKTNTDSSNKYKKINTKDNNVSNTELILKDNVSKDRNINQISKIDEKHKMDVDDIGGICSSSAVECTVNNKNTKENVNVTKKQEVCKNGNNDIRTTQNDESNKEKVPEIAELRAAVDELAKEFRLNEPLASAKRRAKSRKPRNRLQQMSNSKAKEKCLTKSTNPSSNTTVTKAIANTGSATTNKKILVSTKQKPEQM